MSAIKKAPVITFEWEGVTYELEADQGLTFDFNTDSGLKLIASSGRLPTAKPKPEPEKPKANITLEILLGGKRYAGKLEEKKQEDRVENTVARPPSYSARRFNDGFTD